jgi:hypothetical protein
MSKRRTRSQSPLSTRILPQIRRSQSPLSSRCFSNSASRRSSSPTVFSVEKRSKNKDYKYHKIETYTSKFKRFTTNKYVTKFVITTLGNEPLSNFVDILDQMLDSAFVNAKNEYNAPPYFYIVTVNGESLDYPVVVRVNDRSKMNLYLVRLIIFC